MNLENNQYQIIVESSPNMIWRSGTDALCNYFNATWLRFSGKSMDEEVGMGWTEGVHPDDYDICLKIYLDAFAKQEAFEMEYRLKRKDGVYRWINDRGTPYYVGDHEFAGYIGSCMDVTDKVEGQRMRELAQKDGLTGIFNRQYFEQLGNVEFLKAKRFHADLSVAMIDIDDFKRINDTYGHIAGDAVLKQVAKILFQGIREYDLLARFGGDEFILLMSHTNQREANILVNRLLTAVHEHIVNYSGKEIKVSASYGIYQLNGEENFEKMIVEADKRLYEMKKQEVVSGEI